MMASVIQRLWAADCRPGHLYCRMRTGGKMQTESKMESAVCNLPSVRLLCPGLQSVFHTHLVEDGCLNKEGGRGEGLDERRGYGTVWKIPHCSYRVWMELDITSAFSYFGANKFSEIFKVWSDRDAIYLMCCSRKYPYPSHRRFCSLNSPTHLEISF